MEIKLRTSRTEDRVVPTVFILTFFKEAGVSTAQVLTK